MTTQRSTAFIIPVQNLTDNLSWTKHNHNLAFGGNVRFIDDQRTGNAQSFPDGQMNQGWLTRSSTIANSHGPFDPQVYGYPAVDFANYGNEYNDALMNMVGTITEGDAVYNYTKSGTHACGWRATEARLSLERIRGLRAGYVEDPEQSDSHLWAAIFVSAGSGGDERHAGGRMPVCRKHLPAICVDQLRERQCGAGGGRRRGKQRWRNSLQPERPL